MTIFPPTRRMLRLDNMIGFPGATVVRCCGVDSEGTNLVLLTAVQQRQRIAPFANDYCALFSRSGDLGGPASELKNRVAPPTAAGIAARADAVAVQRRRQATGQYCKIYPKYQHERVSFREC